MHQTSKTNVNLNIVNLIPAMDQVLEDYMIGLAEADQGASMEGMAAWCTFKLIPNDLYIHSQIDPQGLKTDPPDVPLGLIIMSVATPYLTVPPSNCSRQVYQPSTNAQPKQLRLSQPHPNPNSQ